MNHAEDDLADKSIVFHVAKLKRNIVERTINQLKQDRRIPTRYEKLAANYTAMITIWSRHGVRSPAFFCGYSLKTRPCLRIWYQHKMLKLQLLLHKAQKLSS